MKATRNRDTTMGRLIDQEPRKYADIKRLLQGGSKSPTVRESRSNSDGHRNDNDRKNRLPHSRKHQIRSLVPGETENPISADFHWKREDQAESSKQEERQ